MNKSVKSQNGRFERNHYKGSDKKLIVYTGYIQNNTYMSIHKPTISTKVSSVHKGIGLRDPPPDRCQSLFAIYTNTLLRAIRFLLDRLKQDQL